MIGVIAAHLVALVATARFLLMTATSAQLELTILEALQFVRLSATSTLDSDNFKASRTIALVTHGLATMHLIVVHVQHFAAHVLARWYGIFARCSNDSLLE